MVGIYVCGITPYDATHIGHAATYLAFDTLIRLWLDGGFQVRYVQNSTDVDDPLLERAARDHVDWHDLAREQTNLFRCDMESLGVIPPDHYIAVTEMMDPIAAAVDSLLERDIAYRLDGDVYFDSARASATSPWTLGDESHLDVATMLALSAERGGDPERPGKRDPLDPLLWRTARDGEPSWTTVLGAGRPGWHIECSVIAQAFLDIPVTVKGGGRDLIFPHHEFSAGHTAALSGKPLAELYAHTGMVSYRGEKMSKSLGNIVLVSDFVAAGTDPRAIRLAILAQHYRHDWEWTDQLLAAAVSRLARWENWAVRLSSTTMASMTVSPPAVDSPSIVDAIRKAIANDLSTPHAIALIDAAIATGEPATVATIDAIDALLGIRLRYRRV